MEFHFLHVPGSLYERDFQLSFLRTPVGLQLYIGVARLPVSLPPKAGLNAPKVSGFWLKQGKRYL